MTRQEFMLWVAGIATMGAFQMRAKNAQAGSVEEALTLRVPPIASDLTWTPEQRADLVNQWTNFKDQQNTVNRGFSERLRQTLISGRTYHTSVHNNP